MSPTILHESTAHELTSQLQLLLSSAAFAPLADIGWLKVTGSDRVRWLNGMVTNSIQDLAPGSGCYNLILNAQGRIQGDAYAFAEPDHLLLETGATQTSNLLALFDRFIIMDDVELADLSPNPSPDRQGLLLAGPQAFAVLASLNLHPPADALTLSHQTWQTAPATVVHAYSPLVSRFELWSDSATIASLSTELAAHGATSVTSQAVSLLRTIEGTPLFGVDIRDRDLPQETGATRALHFAKGCYLGQEIVERIRSRGNVHRTFSGFLLEGADAAPGQALSADGKPVGELTGIATLPSLDGQRTSRLALGYIRREALVAGKPILYEGGIATPTPLPFDTAKIL